jgi:hypothetical protein
MPKPRSTRVNTPNAYRTEHSANTGLHGIPGLSEAGGWDDPAFPHICQVAMEMRGAGVELTRETMNAVVKMGRERHAQGKTPDGGAARPAFRPFPSREEFATKGVVYYVRRGGFIKIGTTVRLKQRMRDLVPDEILAVRPGSYPLEKKLHERFEHLRAPFMREYFRIAPELTEHIALVVAKHGPPPDGLLTFG